MTNDKESDYIYCEDTKSFISKWQDKMRKGIATKEDHAKEKKRMIDAYKKLKINPNKH